MSLAIIVKNIITHILCNVISPEHCTLYILLFLFCMLSIFMYFFLLVSCVSIKMLKKKEKSLERANYRKWASEITCIKGPEEFYKHFTPNNISGKNSRREPSHISASLPCGIKFSREFDFADCRFFCISRKHIFANLDFRLNHREQIFADFMQVFL